MSTVLKQSKAPWQLTDFNLRPSFTGRETEVCKAGIGLRLGRAVMVEACRYSLCSLGLTPNALWQVGSHPGSATFWLKGHCW